MPDREPTIDGLDDTDDEDGTLEEEQAADTDLTLHETDQQHAGLGTTPPGVDPYIEDAKRKRRKERE